MILTFTLILGLLFVPTRALADDPQVTVTRMENLPNRLFYFDDTPVSSLFCRVTSTVS